MDLLLSEARRRAQTEPGHDGALAAACERAGLGAAATLDQLRAVWAARREPGVGLDLAIQSMPGSGATEGAPAWWHVRSMVPYTPDYNLAGHLLEDMEVELVPVRHGKPNVLTAPTRVALSKLRPAVLGARVSRHPDPWERVLDAIEDLASQPPPAVVVRLDVPRHLARKEKAVLIRELLRATGVQPVSITVPMHSMASMVEVRIPGPPRHIHDARVRGCETCLRQRRAEQALEGAIVARFPAWADQSRPEVDYFDACVNVSSR